MSADEVLALRGRGRWAEALNLVADPLVRADLLHEEALFAGDAEARRAAETDVVRGASGVAEPYFRDSYDLAREHGDTKLMSYDARHLGFVDYEAGRLDEAERRLRESVELREGDGFLPGVAAGLLTLAEVAFDRGRDVEAPELLARARELAVETGAAAFLRRIETTAAEHGA